MPKFKEFDFSLRKKSNQQMNNRRYLLQAACVSLFLTVGTISNSFAQFGGYGNGYGRGGMGGGGFGGSQMGGPSFDTSKPKPPLDPDEVAKEETKFMVKKLKLTDEQEIVISSLNEDYAYQRKDLYEQIKRDFGLVPPTPAQIDTAKEKMLALEARKDKELEKILTPEQFKIYQDIKAKNMKNAKKG